MNGASFTPKLLKISGHCHLSTKYIQKVLQCTKSNSLIAILCHPCRSLVLLQDYGGGFVNTNVFYSRDEDGKSSWSLVGLSCVL